MKNILLFLFMTLSIITHARVAIITDGVLPGIPGLPDIKSTVKGLLLPGMTIARRESIS
jgi:hypothetical protein